MNIQINHKYYLVVPDIQSEFEVFEELVNIWHKERVFTRYEDLCIVFLGDYFDRGTKATEKFHLMLSLQDKVPVYFIKGNHESILGELLYPSDDLSNRMLWENNAKINGTYKTVKDLAKNLDDALTQYGDHRFVSHVKKNHVFMGWFNGLWDIVETDKLVFSHAPILTQSDYDSYDNWQNCSEKVSPELLNYSIDDRLYVCGHVHSHRDEPRYYVKHHYLDTMSNPIYSPIYDNTGVILDQYSFKKVA